MRPKGGGRARSAPSGKGKYARVERARRFPLGGVPGAGSVARRRRITDRYLDGTRLRLRRDEDTGGGGLVLKLTQKVPAGRAGFARGLITNTYLSPDEYELLASLPAAVLSKTRLSVPPLGVDVFDPPPHGLVLAEAEFTSDEDALAFRPPEGAVAEVTDDVRFTGGSLVRAARGELLGRLAEYGVDVPAV